MEHVVNEASNRGLDHHQLANEKAIHHPYQETLEKPSTEIEREIEEEKVWERLPPQC